MLSISSIIEEIQKARTNVPINKTFYSIDSLKGKNQFLFFIKPELTLDDGLIRQTDVLSMVLEKLKVSGMHIMSASIINASFLESNNVIARHYGIINQVASDANKHLTTDSKKVFEQIYGIPIHRAKVLGSIELLQKYDNIDINQLNNYWFDGEMKKLAGGTYVVKTQINKEDVFIVNGFHPQQLLHFTAPKRCIICFNIVSDIDWFVARNEVLGVTNPAEAHSGSIRRQLFDNQQNYGLNINYSTNGAHLSAGPFEALIELMRYSYYNDRKVNLCDFQFGNELLEVFTEDEIHFLLQNPILNYKGERHSVFDLTEELNAKDSLERLQEIKSRQID